MSGHWYDGLGTGIGSLVDMFTGAAPGSTHAGAKAAAAPVAAEGKHVADNTNFGKATGLAPFMKMLGIGQEPAKATPEDRMATPSELADAKAGKVATAGGSDRYSADVKGNKDSKGFAKVTTADGKSGGYTMPSIQNWDARGKSYGNRQSDIDARDKGVKVGAPEIYQPDLSKIPRVVTGQKSDERGAGHFREDAYGSHLDGYKADGTVDDGWSGISGKTKFDPASGKGSTSLYSRGYQAGVEKKEGYRAVAFSDDKRHSASAEAGLVANAGLSGSVGADTKNGLYATGGIGAKAGAYAQGDANTKTGKVNVGGQQFDAGIGAHGDVFVGAKAGASGTVGLGPDFVGAKGSIGAFAGAEAAGDIHGNLGPVGAKLGGSVMAGAGIGADGDISFKDGKFHMGGKLFAALGYGGSISGDVTVDFAKAGKALYGLGQGAVEGISNGASYLGNGIADGASYLGSGIASGASYVGNGIADGASYLGS
ncbi:MAG: hypothetical protein ACTHU0_37895, partial [Kofleriaceae bacterium]